MTRCLRIGIVGCGLIGGKRADSMAGDRVERCFDVDRDRAAALAARLGATATDDLDELLEPGLDVVVVSTTHDALAPAAIRALESGAHVLVEKPAGLTVEQLDAIASAASAAGRLVKVGFNHRFHPGTARAVELFLSGELGEPMYLCARYGHGGRPGYEREWRAQPELSGGGELIDQGMHLLDLSYWALGDLPLQSALVRTSFWDMTVDDNAVLSLGDPDDRHATWASFHVSCSEWKNEFALDLYTTRVKLSVTGLARSYGPQKLRIYRMHPEMGPPDLEEIDFPIEDVSWEREWQHFRTAIIDGATNGTLLGNLASARYALARVGDAYRAAGYTGVTGTAGFASSRGADR
jgi:predicted dehydrogenase